MFKTVHSKRIVHLSCILILILKQFCEHGVRCKTTQYTYSFTFLSSCVTLIPIFLGDLRDKMTDGRTYIRTDVKNDGRTYKMTGIFGIINLRLTVPTELVLCERTYHLYIYLIYCKCIDTLPS